MLLYEKVELLSPAPHCRWYSGFYAGTLENFAAREKSPPRVVLAETLTEGRANPALPIRLPFRFLFFARFALP